MEYLTITEEAKYAVVAICNESVVKEYDFILGYPRIIDHMVNFEKITDKQLLDDIEKLGKDSLVHFGILDNIIQSLGAETVWLPSILPRLVDVAGILEQQLEKEKAAQDLYKEARKVAIANKTTVKKGGISSMFQKARNIPESEVIHADQIISKLDRLISDEERHIRVVSDSIATITMLLNR